MCAVVYFVCEKCGAFAPEERARVAGWLVAPAKGGRLGEMVIRCPRHVTMEALAAADIDDESAKKFRRAAGINRRRRQ